MQRIKLIGLDLDGTLLNEKKELTRRTKSALEQAISEGVHVVISTGRPISGIPKALLEISGMKYVITSNGGRILDLETGKVVYENPVSHDSAERILKITKEYQTLNEIYFDGIGYVQEDELEQIHLYVKKPPMQEYIVKTRQPVKNIWQKMDEMQGKGLDKVHALFADLEELAEAKARVEAMNEVVVSSSLGNNMEMNAPGVHKGEALIRLGRMLGISRDEIMACGDGGNDLTMVQMAGFGVAMKNAIDEVKQVADYITDTNDEDGVAKAVEQFVLLRQ